jgi:hypothetical protein
MLPFLSSVGRPVAVNADAGLRATARAHGWPILDLTATGNGPRPAALLDRALDGALRVLRLLESKR